MDPVEALTELGGVARLGVLLRLTSRKRLRSAVAAGKVLRISRDRYRLPVVDEALVEAVRLGGVASHLSAAVLHGWEVAHAPTCAWLTVPRNREVRDRGGSYVFWADLDDEPGPVTSPLRTVLDCGRRLAFAPALTVADSALRRGAVAPDALAEAAARARGKGTPGLRRVVAHASGSAANPFESVLRALAIDAGLTVRPQVPVELGGLVVHPDVVDEGRRLAIEADSFEFHTGRDAHARDCRRYTLLTVGGWRVLRFTWREVMHEPSYVLDCLRRVT